MSTFGLDDKQDEMARAWEEGQGGEAQEAFRAKDRPIPPRVQEMAVDDIRLLREAVTPLWRPCGAGGNDEGRYRAEEEETRSCDSWRQC